MGDAPDAEKKTDLLNKLKKHKIIFFGRFLILYVSNSDRGRGENRLAERNKNLGATALICRFMQYHNEKTNWQSIC